MKPRLPHTIVNLPDDLLLPRKQARDLISASLRVKPELAGKVENLPTALQSLVLSSAALEIVNSLKAAYTKSSKGTKTRWPSETKVVAEVERALAMVNSDPDVITIGLLDLGARIGSLTALLNRLNSAQRRFAFVEVQTPVPAGLVKSPQHIRNWIDERSAKPLTEHEAQQLTPTLVIDDFFHVAQVVREQTSVKLLVGISPTLLAQQDAEGARWDLHASGGLNVCVVSTHGLRGYAREANRPFEAAVGMLIVGQVLTWQDPLVPYHRETRGCVLDYNETPAEIVSSIRAMTIELSCQKQFVDKRDADAAVAMMRSLRAMRS